MKPQEWEAALSRILERVEQGAKEAADKGALGAVKGRRAPGHRIAYRDMRIRVSGPMAPSVAAQLAKDAAEGAQKEIRGLLP